ncbi:stalk domain-containing protein [Neofamilia massiliensis]|uniref:stalk domain-containing protein n=1 Tax=Neofamilia massiliensis TaxID=1673724 RepID=UPI0006BB91B4|nr:stalk domain-containing protein [Neofamilia massiliensis]
MKKILFFSMALVLMFSSLALAKEEPVKFAMDFAKVEEVNEKDDSNKILVASDSDSETALDKVYLFTKDVPVMDLKTGELVENYKFKKGEEIQYFYREDTPMLMSYPGQMTPNFIGVNVKDSKYSLEVDYFNKEGKGISNRLELNLTDENVAKNLKGEEVKDFLEKDLAVLYTVATRSLPPIARPEKIIVLDIPKKVVDLMDYKSDDDKGYLLRAYYEDLGAQVTWEKSDDTTTISLKDKTIKIYNKEAKLEINKKVETMKDFSVVDGISYIQEEDINKINKFLFE